MGKRRKLVEVTWVDSVSHGRVWSDHGWHEGVKPDKVVSVGYLMRRDEDSVVIASHIGDHDTSVSGGMCIPACSITQIRRMRSRPRRGKK